MKNPFVPFFSDRAILNQEIHARTLRYSSNVRFWKLALPIIAVGAFSGLFAWPYLADHLNEIDEGGKKTAYNMPEIKLTNRLLNPHLNTIDSKGRPITIQAESAIQTADNSAEMINPKSQIHLENGQKIAVQSDNGLYNPEEQTFQYKEHVLLQSQDGTQLATSSASIDLSTNQAYGDMPVRGEGPTGKIQSDGFKILKEGKEVHLLGKSKLTITNNNG